MGFLGTERWFELPGGLIDGFRIEDERMVVIWSSGITSYPYDFVVSIVSISLVVVAIC